MFFAVDPDGEPIIHAILVLIVTALSSAVIAAYMIPYAAACAHAHSQCHLVGVLNLLLGWTFVGWIALLVWAMNGKQRSLPKTDAGGDSPLTHTDQSHAEADG